MAPLPQVHAERGSTAVPSFGDDDPVLSALRRYRDAAGSTFHPLSEVEEPDEVAVDSSSSRFVVAKTPAFASDTPKNRPTITENFSNFEEDFRHVVCGLASMDMGELLPSWLGWINPWLEPTEPDLCGAVPQRGHFRSTSSAAWSDASFGSAASPRETKEEGFIDCMASAERGPAPVAFSPPPSQACRTRLPGAGRRRDDGAKALEAIRELPHGLRSSTFDELLIPDLDAAQAWPPLPDFSKGIELGATFADFCEGWGIGKVCEATISGTSGGRSSDMLIVELRLNAELNAAQLRRLGASLRRSTSLPQRNDLACALGAVAAGDGPGVWIAWERPAGSSDISPLPTELLQPRGMDWRLKVARHLCLTMAALHRSGQEHGSLAPRNVLVNKDGEVTLMERGLVNALLEVEALHEHDLLGALGLAFARYLPPEGWHVPRSAGVAADIFALGLVLLEVLDAASIPNPECKSLQQLSAKMLPKRGRWQPQVKRGLYDELPQKTRHIIESCFNPDPEQRPGAEELLFSLAAPKEDADASPYIKEPSSMLLSNMSDGMKSGSTGTGSARSQDLEMDLGADLPEEPIVKTMTQAPRHVSWPAARVVPGVMETLSSAAGMGVWNPVASPGARAFSADDVDLLKPLPPPPPQPQVKHLPPPMPRGEISPRSPGPPLPPPPPAMERKEMRAPEPASSESDPPSSDESNSRPPSPPRVPLVEAQQASLADCRSSGHRPWQAFNASWRL